MDKENRKPVVEMSRSEGFIGDTKPGKLSNLNSTQAAREPKKVKTGRGSTKAEDDTWVGTSALHHWDRERLVSRKWLNSSLINSAQTLIKRA